MNIKKNIEPPNNESEFNSSQCRLTNLDHLNREQPVDIKIYLHISDLPYDFAFTGQYTDVDVYIDANNMIDITCGSVIYPVRQNVDDLCLELTETILRFHACVRRNGERFIYASKIDDSDESFCPGYHKQLANLLNAKAICTGHDCNNEYQQQRKGG